MKIGKTSQLQAIDSSILNVTTNQISNLPDFSNHVFVSASSNFDVDTIIGTGFPAGYVVTFAAYNPSTGVVTFTPNGNLNINNSFALDTLYKSVSMMYDGTSIWNRVSNIGVQGAQGMVGAQGNSGDGGVDGPQGPQGAQGDNGNPGSQGSQGTQGPPGDTGDQGPTF